MEREWRLGNDLDTSDNLLDGITFDELILTVHCNCRSITPKTVRKELMEIVELKMEDMRELLERNVDYIIAAAKEGRCE